MERLGTKEIGAPVSLEATGRAGGAPASATVEVVAKGRRRPRGFQ